MILFYDFEVFKHTWLVVIVDAIAQKETIIVNDSAKMTEFYESHKNYIWIGYNSNSFDAWILRAILGGYDPYQMSQWIIAKERKGWEFDRELSRFQVLGFDARWSNIAPGLKTLEAFMGDDIRETEVPFDLDRPLTEEEIAQTIKYCRNDVNETMKVFCHAKQEFNAQWELIKLFDLPLTAISKTKAQLTANILNCVKTDRNDEWNFNLEAPCYLVKKYKNVVEWFENTENRNLEAGFEAEIAGIKVTYGWGGCHGAIENYFDEGRLVHCDVNSYYPSLMIQWGLLSRNSQTPEKFKEIYETRLALKRAGKKKEQAPYKIILNSTYGASGDTYNPLYDPRQAHRVCANGQIFLTLLLEMLEGIATPFNVNTDGIFFKIDDESKLDIYYEKCKEWEQLTRMGLGHDKYKACFQKDVNNYIMVLEDGSLERKGAVVKSLSTLDNDLKIVNEAVVQYFVNGVQPEKTIQDCHNMLDFQKVFKLSSKYNLAMQGCTFRTEKSKKVWNGDGIYLTDRTYRVFANLEPTGAVYKKKDGKNPEKFANCPDNCFIYNESLQGKTTDEFPNLDKKWYIDLAWYRIKQFKGEIK